MSKKYEISDIGADISSDVKTHAGSGRQADYGGDLANGKVDLSSVAFESTPSNRELMCAHWDNAIPKMAAKASEEARDISTKGYATKLDVATATGKVIAAGGTDLAKGVWHCEGTFIDATPHELRPLVLISYKDGNGDMKWDYIPAKDYRDIQKLEQQENPNSAKNLNSYTSEENTNDGREEGDNIDNDTGENLKENHPESTESMSEENIEQSPVETENHSTDSQVEDELESTRSPEDCDEFEKRNEETDQEMITDDSQEDSRTESTEPLDNIPIEEEPESPILDDSEPMQDGLDDVSPVEEVEPATEEDQPVDMNSAPEPIVDMPVDEVPVEVD